MGSLAGILHWDGRALEPPDLDRVARAATLRVTDALTSRISGPVGLARLRYDTTPIEDPAQPLVDVHRDLLFAFDGRLDNRTELSARLDLEPSATDARIALEAFACWDEEAAARLLGDFAFIAWDGRRRRMVCARDHVGVRPLHYYASPRMLVCGTDLVQVLAHPAVRREPNPVVAAAYLARNLPNGSETLFRGVHRVPPGHFLVADNQRVELRCYWSAVPGTPIRYHTDEEYAEQCREILVRSVGDRMRGDRPVAAFLSGGLDSSSVVTAGHRLVAGRGAAPRPFSMIFPDHPESDERPFIDAVTRACGTTGVHVVPGPITAAALTERTVGWAELPGMAADEMTVTTFRSMVAHGHRVALTGAGGDFLFTGSVFQYADLLRARRPLAAVKRFVDDWRADDTGRTALGLVQAGVWPLLPPRCKTVLRPLARRVYGVRDQPGWVRIRIPQAEHPGVPPGGSHAAEEIRRGLGSGMHAFFLESHERAAAESGIELRHPLLDRRLIEFALNIPDEQRKRGPYTKFVLRRALGSHLASPVSQRRTKADFSHAVVEAIEALGGERLFGSLRIAEAGWVDPRPVVNAYRCMRAGVLDGRGAPGIHVPSLWMVAAVELWFRATFDADAGQPDSRRL